MIVPFLDGMGLAVQRIHSGPPRGLYPAENMIFLRGRMGNVGGDGGGLEVFVDDGMGLAVRRLPRDFGDYILGPGIDQLIRQFGENDANRHEGHPASQSSVDAMPTIAIGSEHLYEDSAQCAVCKDQYELGSEVRQMPCNHMYHADCILPWLAHHNSCPVCRFEMPTEQSTSNSAGTANHTSSNSSGGRASGGNGSRRNSFNFPWPFRFLNSNASTSADLNPNPSSSAGSNQRRQSSRGH
ncbi:hypothetical protein O6H91_03G125400 [Diphasiastrum complanatum]|nr:hypothetical protein O6H91_03G125400 [Diphasiastrum complanatum]